MTIPPDNLNGFPKVKLEIEKVLVTAKTRRLKAQWTWEAEETAYYDPREKRISHGIFAYDLLRYFAATSRSHCDPTQISHAAVALADDFYTHTAHQQIITPYDLIMTRDKPGVADPWAGEIALLRGQHDREVSRTGGLLFDAFVYMVETHFTTTLWVKRLDLPDFERLCAHNGISGRIAIMYCDAPHILIAFKREEDAFAFKMASTEPVLFDLKPNEA